jgi:TolB-like protein
MSRLAILIVQLFTFTSLVFPNKASVKTKPSIPSKKLVAVLGFSANNKTYKLAGAMRAVFTSKLASLRRYRVVERVRLKQIVAEQRLQLSDITDQSSAVKVGKLLCVRYIFLGKVLMLGDKYLLIIKRINVETGVIEDSYMGTASKHTQLLKLAENLAKKASSKKK